MGLAVSGGQEGKGFEPVTVSHWRSLSPILQEKRRGWRLLDRQVETAEHSWVHWRSLHVSDAEDTSGAVWYDASV